MWEVREAMIKERGGEDKVAARRELPWRLQNPGAKDSELRLFSTPTFFDKFALLGKLEWVSTSWASPCRIKRTWSKGKKKELSFLEKGTAFCKG